MSTFLLHGCTETAKILKCGCNHDVATSLPDVIIVFLICTAITIIATYGICRYYANKERERENQKEIESVKHTWEENEKICKQKAELQNKLLDFQAGLAFPYEKKSGGGFEKKDYDSNKSEKYQKTLISLLEKFESTN